MGSKIICLFDKIWYTSIMNKQEKQKLIQAYTRYRALKIEKQDVLRFFRSFMPEIIFRTTKLEGESVTRKMITALFK